MDRGALPAVDPAMKQAGEPSGTGSSPAVPGPPLEDDMAEHEPRTPDFWLAVAILVLTVWCSVLTIKLYTLGAL